MRTANMRTHVATGAAANWISVHLAGQRRQPARLLKIRRLEPLGLGELAASEPEPGIVCPKSNTLTLGGRRLLPLIENGLPV